MPIANCFINESIPDTKILEEMASKFAKDIGVSEQDVCLNFIQNYWQAGIKYKIMCNLFLPSLWNDVDIQRIQSSLKVLLNKYMKATDKEVFIITTMVESGNIIEDGNAVVWK